MHPCKNRPVYLRAAALISAAGDHCADLLGPAPVAQPLAFDPNRLGHVLAPITLASKVFDRRISRGLEPQGLRILHCADALAEALEALQVPAARRVLTAAIPEVDGPSTSWDAVEAIIDQPQRLLEQFMAHTPPMHALTLLNSSVMAYLAQGLGIRGAMGGFCSQANAGIDALAEACSQLSEGHGDAALVVGSSPNITPALYLREIDLTPRVHGEGAAALLLDCQGDADSLRIAGIGRGYSHDPARALQVAQRVIDQALRAERLTLGDIGRVVVDPHDSLIRQWLDADVRLVDGIAGLVGDLGAAQPLGEAALALYRQRSGGTADHTLLLERSRAGHWGAVLLVAPHKEVA